MTDNKQQELAKLCAVNSAATIIGSCADSLGTIADTLLAFGFVGEADQLDAAVKTLERMTIRFSEDTITTILVMSK